MHIEMRAAGQCVSGNMVKDRALQMANSVEFRASNGWLQNFLMRRCLVRRGVTTSGSDLPADAIVLARGFLESDANKYCWPNFSRASLLNMDETCLYLDDSTNYTIERVGSHRVPWINTGNERTRVSVAFCASAADHKLTPIILIPSMARSTI